MAANVDAKAVAAKSKDSHLIIRVYRIKGRAPSRSVNYITLFAASSKLVQVEQGPSFEGLPVQAAQPILTEQYALYDGLLLCWDRQLK